MAGEERERCPDCGCEKEQPDVHREHCPRLGSVLQFGPPWLPLPDRVWPRDP